MNWPCYCCFFLCSLINCFPAFAASNFTFPVMLFVFSSFYASVIFRTFISLYAFCLVVFSHTLSFFTLFIYCSYSSFAFPLLVMDLPCSLMLTLPPLYSQNDVFYAPPWSRTMETLLLFLLVSERCHRRWVAGDSSNNYSILSNVRFHAIFHYRPSYNFPECLYRMKYVEWSRRFSLFR